MDRRCPYRRVLLHLLVLLAKWTFVSTEEKNSGKWDIDFNKLEQCEEGSVSKEILVLNSTKINKISKTEYMYSSDMLFVEPVTNDMKVHINIHRFGNGGYKPNFMDLDFDRLCDTVKTYVPVFFNKVMSAVNKTDCPIPAGFYKLVDMPATNIDLRHIPTFVYGKYRMKTFGLNKEGEVIGCIYLYMDVIPKKKTKKKT